jgi:hypothetical protein
MALRETTDCSMLDTLSDTWALRICMGVPFTIEPDAD